MDWIFQLIGRLHPMIVHFPIGLIFVALLLEMLTYRGKQGLREGISWLVNLGALSAIIASIMGILLINFDSYGGDLVLNHQIAGLLTTLFSIITAILLHRAKKAENPNFLPYRISLILTTVILTVAGHLGASLTHGEDFLTELLPGKGTNYDNSKTGALLAEVSMQDSVSIRQLDRISLEVRAIFAHSCYQCHSEEKQKGDLALDSKEGVFAGGESGPILTIGDAKNSEIIRRITLPKNHDEVMPKKGKILSPEEVNLISWWIDNGAHWVDGDVKIFPEAPLALSKPKLPPAEGSLQHPIDRLVNVYFEKNRVSWPEVVDDKKFIQRAYLDIIGLLPSPDQIQQFEQNTNPNN